MMEWPLFEFDYLPAVFDTASTTAGLAHRELRLRGQQMILWLTVKHPIELPEDPYTVKRGSQ
jgi:hypothetical protein